VTYRRVLDWIIEFIGILFTQLGTTGNCGTIAEFSGEAEVLEGILSPLPLVHHKSRMK
jgi:hypothetical protein